MDLGDITQALSRASQAAASDKTNPVYLYTLALIAEEAGLTDQAAEAYRKSASLDPLYAKPRINLGALYERIGRGEEALEYLLEALKLEPDSPAVWNNLGKTYLNMNDYANSLGFFRRAAAALPKDVELQMNLALALTETGAAPQAADAYRRVIELEPSRGEAYDRLARLQFSSGDPGAAAKVLADLERAVPGYSGLDELRSFLR